MLYTWQKINLVVALVIDEPKSVLVVVVGFSGYFF